MPSTHSQSFPLVFIPLCPRYSGLSLPSPCPLKVAAATHNGHTLIHDRLADPKVAVDPLADTRRFGEGV